MVGLGNYSEYPPDMVAERDNVLRMEDEGWVRQKAGAFWNGPEISFCYSLIEDNPNQTIGIIKVAIGGIGIRSLSPNWTYQQAEMMSQGEWGPLYRIVRERITQAKALCNAEFAGVLWKQGESEMIVEDTAYGYLGHLQLIIETIRTDTGGKSAVLCGQLC